jgi:hypothetical protein
MKTLIIYFLMTMIGMAQDWSAATWWGAQFKSSVTNINGVIAMSIPDICHTRPPLTGARLSFLTTTNNWSLLGNLVGKTVSATIQLETINNPILEFGNDSGEGLRCSNVRLYFTTTRVPYVNTQADANETQYWWADVGWVALNNGNPAPAIAGIYTLTVPIDPALWSDSQGRSGSILTNEFYRAARGVRQIGLSFGGGDYFDTGTRVNNLDHPESAAMFYILDYRVVQPIRKFPFTQPLAY